MTSYLDGNFSKLTHSRISVVITQNKVVTVALFYDPLMPPLFMYTYRSQPIHYLLHLNYNPATVNSSLSMAASKDFSVLTDNWEDYVIQFGKDFNCPDLHKRIYTVTCLFPLGDRQAIMTYRHVKYGTYVLILQHPPPTAPFEKLRVHEWLTVAGEIKTNAFDRILRGEGPHCLVIGDRIFVTRSASGNEICLKVGDVEMELEETGLANLKRLLHVIESALVIPFP